MPGMAQNKLAEGVCFFQSVRVVIVDPYRRKIVRKGHYFLGINLKTCSI